MNERLKELVEQCGFYVTEKNGAALYQFAELIMEDNERLLKMSLEALQYMKADYLRKDGLGFDLIASSKMFDTLKKLEEHFGVEE